MAFSKLSPPPLPSTVSGNDGKDPRRGNGWGWSEHSSIGPEHSRKDAGRPPVRSRREDQVPGWIPLGRDPTRGLRGRGVTFLYPYFPGPGSEGGENPDKPASSSSSPVFVVQVRGSTYSQVEGQPRPRGGDENPCPNRIHRDCSDRRNGTPGNVWRKKSKNKREKMCKRKKIVEELPPLVRKVKKEKGTLTSHLHIIYLFLTQSNFLRLYGK